MVNQKELVKHGRPHRNLPDIYSLPAIKGISRYKSVPHELDCANLFVAFWQTGKLQHWDNAWDADEKKAFNIGSDEKKQQYPIWYDRRLKLADELFLLEVDRGTEHLTTQFNEKIELYIRFFQHLKNSAANILFTVQDWRYGYEDPEGALERTREMLNLFARKKNTRIRFFVALHSDVLENPLAPIWFSPTFPDKKVVLTELS